MAYADYIFYKNTYKGKLSGEDFDILSERATELIDGYTDHFIARHGEIESLSADLALRVKKCCCALAEAMNLSKNGSSGAVTSEKVGDYSVTYSSTTVTFGKRIESILFNYIPDLAKAARWT